MEVGTPVVVEIKSRGCPSDVFEACSQTLAFGLAVHNDYRNTNPLFSFIVTPKEWLIADLWFLEDFPEQLFQSKIS